MDSLDLFSTSPTYSEGLCFKKTEKRELLPCVNHAPLFAYNTQGRTYGIVQGCCNSWTCPRCGQQRARQEYGRIVEGCKILGEQHNLYFVTITCRGRDLSIKDAEEGYGEWTNRALDAWRLQGKRTGQKWAYVQVTERQARAHPHSHFITTFRPTDLAIDWKRKRVVVEGRSFMAHVSAYRSEYLSRTLYHAGLGSEYDITKVESVAGVSRYVAKYLFKPTIFSTVWPKNWRRVRYSQSFPKLPEKRSNAFVLLDKRDWDKLANVAAIIKPTDDYCLAECTYYLRGADAVVLKPMD